MRALVLACFSVCACASTPVMPVAQVPPVTVPHMPLTAAELEALPDGHPGSGGWQPIRQLVHVRYDAAGRAGVMAWHVLRVYQGGVHELRWDYGPDGFAPYIDLRIVDDGREVRVGRGAFVERQVPNSRDAYGMPSIGYGHLTVTFDAPKGATLELSGTPGEEQGLSLSDQGGRFDWRSLQPVPTSLERGRHLGAPARELLIEAPVGLAFAWTLDPARGASAVASHDAETQRVLVRIEGGADPGALQWNVGP